MKNAAFFFIITLISPFALMGQSPDKSDISYGALESEKLDYWQAAEDKSPIILLIPGTDWNSNDKSTQPWIEVASFFHQNGYAVVSIDYVLSSDPAYKGYPQQPANLACALAWTREHASLLNGDPDRIFLLGASAGAHLASLHALQPEVDGKESDCNADLGNAEPSVAAVIALSGLYDFDLIPKESNTKKAIMNMLRDSTAHWKAAQPIEARVGEHPETGFLLLHGTRDAFAGNNQPKAFYDFLTNNHYAVEMDILEDRKHDLINDLSDPESWTAQRILSYANAISRALEPQEPTAVLPAGNSSSLKVYPNPTEGKLHIALESGTYRYAELILTDIEGREIWHTQRLYGNEFILNVADYPPGPYILNVFTDRDKHLKKIVIY
jgi:acetyl esterase/lipase